jgi:AhpD family alkylhydroperoxidase
MGLCGNKWFTNLLLIAGMIVVVAALGLSQSDSGATSAEEDQDVHTYPSILAKAGEYMEEFQQGQPKVASMWWELNDAATAPGALDSKTKKLISLGIAVSSRCDECIAFHIEGLLEEDVTREELMEVLGVAVMMGAGPPVAYSTHVLEAYDEFTTTGMRIPRPGETVE